MSADVETEPDFSGTIARSLTSMGFVQGNVVETAYAFLSRREATQLLHLRIRCDAQMGSIASAGAVGRREKE